MLAQSIIWIETGPTDFVVWLFYLLGIITIIYYFYNLANGSEENLNDNANVNDDGRSDCNGDGGG